MSATLKFKTTDLKAIRLLREEKEITRDELANTLGVSYKAIEKFENGRLALSQDKREKLFKVLGLNEKELRRIKKHWVVVPKRTKTVFENCQRRSYQKVITKEVRILTLLRKRKKLTQDKASALCGYSRPSIGHIENGRIEITSERIRHIASSYGFSLEEFENLMGEEIIREDLLLECHERLDILSEEKLKLMHAMLKSF
jgi:transcriptional regulator with XRE-family HTH domain